MKRVGADRVKWHRKLSVQLALWLVVTLIFVLFLAPSLWQSLDEWLLPHSSQGYVVFLPSPDELTPLADLLLVTTRADEDAQQLPAAEALRVVSAALTNEGLDFAWLDANNRILFQTGVLWCAPGTRLPLPENPEATIRFPDGSDRLARAVHVTRSRAGMTGTLVVLAILDANTLIYGPDAYQGELDGTPVLDDDAVAMKIDESTGLPVTIREGEYANWESAIIAAMAFLVVIAVAAVAATAISFMVTRRLVQLSKAAGVPVTAGEPLPGPFNAAGPR